MMAARFGWLDRVPIKRKLVGLMVVVMAAAFGVAGVITGLYGYRADHRAMEQHLDILASAIGDNCSAALVFEDEAAAAEILDALAFDRSITGALLMDGQSRTIAIFPDEARVAELRAHGGRGGAFGVPLRVNRVISVEGKAVGYLTIWANDEAIVERSITGAVVGITAFVVGILVVMLLFERAQRTLFAPMVDLQETVRRVVRSRNYSIRAARSADDEINDVVMAVNDLLAQVEQLSQASSATTDSAVKPDPAPARPVATDPVRVPGR